MKRYFVKSLIYGIAVCLILSYYNDFTTDESNESSQNVVKKQYHRIPSLNLIIKSGTITGDAFKQISKILGSITIAKDVNQSSHKPDEISSLSKGSNGKLFSGKPFRTFPLHQLKFENSKEFKQKYIEKSESLCKSKHWAVLTTISEPSEAVRRLRYTKLCVVIVGDEDLPKNGYKIRSTLGKNMIFLDKEEQNKINSDFVNGLKWNHFGRKNVGYLYAIAHGAEIVLDFDDYNMFKFWMERATLTKELDFSTYIPNNYFTGNITVYKPAFSYDEMDLPLLNPYSILGCAQKPCWPRGFPLNTILTQHNNPGVRLNLTTIEWAKVGILQSLADYDPDVDAIFKFVQKIPYVFNLKNSPFKEMAKDPHPLLIPKGIYSPMNAQAAFFYQPAFFTLYLPITVHGRVTDIWRSYIAESLLNLCNIHVGFLPKPLFVQEINQHNNQADLNNEIPLYTQTEELIHFLANWTRETKQDIIDKKSVSFVQIVESLWIKLYERGYIEIDDIFSIQKWIKNLFDIGYSFPELDQPNFNPKFDPQYPALDVKDSINFNVGKTVLQTEVPEHPSNCNNIPVKTFWTSDLHDGTRQDHPTALSFLNQTVILAGVKRYKDVYGVLKSPNINVYTRLSKAIFNYRKHSTSLKKGQVQENINFYKHDPMYLNTDAFMCGFPSSMCQLWIPSNKSVMFISAHRYNLGRCSMYSWGHLNDQLISISKNPRHLVAGLSRYDMEYTKYYTGIKNVKLVESFSGFYTSGNPFQPTNTQILGVHKNKDLFNMLAKKIEKNFKLKSIHKLYRHFKLSDIMSHRAVVYLTYSVMSYKMTEFYSLGIPLFVPSLYFYSRSKDGFGSDRTSTSYPYCAQKDGLNRMPQANGSTHPYHPNLTKERNAEQYWLQFADFYNWPHITYFDGAHDLEAKLKSANFQQIHENMMKENRLRKFTLLETWCDIIKEI